MEVLVLILVLRPSLVLGLGLDKKSLIYITDAAVWKTSAPTNSLFELLWVKVIQGCHVTIIGALYHPPAPKYSTSDLLNYIEAAVIQAHNEFPQVHIILAGDLNTLSDSELNRS